jgi:hypothetical protein
MNGTTIVGGGTVASNPGPSWHAIGAGVEGTASDILFQSTSGQTAIWDMKGASIVGGGGWSAPTLGRAGRRSAWAFEETERAGRDRDAFSSGISMMK